MNESIKTGILAALAVFVPMIGVCGLLWHRKTVARIDDLETRLVTAQNKAEAGESQTAGDRAAVDRFMAKVNALPASVKGSMAREAKKMRESLLAQTQQAEGQAAERAAKTAEDIASLRATMVGFRSRQDKLDAFWARKGEFLPPIPAEDLAKGYAPPWKGDERLPMQPVDGAVIPLEDNAGVLLAGGAYLRSAAPATNLSKALMDAGDFSVEVILRPANLTQNGPARIVSISQDPSLRNFTIGQEGTGIFIRLRTTKTDGQGHPALQVRDVLTGEGQHILFVRRGEDHILYVDGKEAGKLTVGGDLSNWDLSMPLMYGNEATGDRDWQGELFRILFFNRALSDEDAAKRYATRPSLPKPPPPVEIPEPAPPEEVKPEPVPAPVPLKPEDVPLFPDP
jgi:concanavalin A-like lectin/glucanase superfamily protein